MALFSPGRVTLILHLVYFLRLISQVDSPDTNAALISLHGGSCTLKTRARHLESVGGAVRVLISHLKKK